MHKGVIAIAAAGALASLIGCGSSDSGTSATSTTSGTGVAAKPANIAYLTYAYTDYVQAEEQGLKDAVVPGGGSVKVFSANFDAGKQQQQCTDAITSGRYNAIVLAPTSAPTGVPCVTAAKAADIPVISIETPVGRDPDAITPTVDGVAGSVVQSPKASADQLVGIVKQACADRRPCRIVAAETPGDPFTTTTVKAVKQQVPGAEIVQTFATNYDPAVVAKSLPDALAAHPDADVFLADADTSALAGVPAVKAAGLAGKLRIIGAGGSRQGAKAVADGTMYGTVGAWPVQGAKLAGQMAIDAVNGKAISPAGVNALTIDTPGRVTPDTVARYKPEWGAQNS